ncbi:MAG: AAA family ATPase [Boseongicola sp.]|nr:AAA family ATPase [Boseongicola sp.]
MSTADEATGTGRYTQATALKDVVTWSQTRPDWQRDALRQLISSADASTIDIDRLEAICIGERTDASYLSETDVAPESTPGKAVAISKLHSLEGVNALVPGQELDVAQNGITIIYGDNGSGKSGYCRVLKHACRSRDDKFQIHPNIDGPDDAVQSATIEFTVGDRARAEPWTPEGQQIAELSQVSIFDCRSANTHVQAENNVAYTPFPMRILEALGDLCDTLKERIDGHIAQIEAQTPLAISEHQFAAETASGKFLNELSAKSNPEVLDLLCRLTEEEKRKLETLRTDLSQDPQKTIKTLGAQAQRVNGVINSVNGLRSAVSVEKRSKHRELSKALADAQAASKAASDSLFKASPLPDIGSDTWKALWEAARSFSDDVAYPDKSFPEATPDEDLCVLCQQPLGDEAVARRLTFESFVKGSTKAQEEECRSTLETNRAALEQCGIADDALAAATTLLGEELGLPDLAASLKEWVDAANGRLTALLEGKDDPATDAPVPLEALTQLRQEFQERITLVQSIQDPEARAKLEQEKRELEERGRLGAIKSDILAQIERLKQVAKLKKVAKTTARLSVTNKNKELSEQLVTGALRNRFAREITKLELNATPMELRKTRDRKAQSFFQVEFVGFPGQPLGEILSEGEHRCVALAAFLAELVTSRDYSGIVFDDPMSSLDHIYRERVAGRLAEEAKHRQVVIFTHDLGFLFEVIREAEALSVPLHYQHVKRRGETPGFVLAELPMKAKTAPTLVAALRTTLKQNKGRFDTMSEIDRVIFTKGVIEQLREAWDQVIADFIAPVLGRFDNKIKGSSLFKLLKLSEADVRTASAARSRLSEDLHDVAEALNPAEVGHDDLAREVDVLHDFIQSMANRPEPSQPKVRQP